MNKVYIIAKTQAVTPEEYRQYIHPIKTRRYGRLVKRALATALKCIQESGIDQPDAIINGTALGSWEDSEKILDGMTAEGEDVSMPTHFMLCTHNMVASIIGIYTHNHGYNNTYSQGKVSLESAMLDAFLQLQMGKIKTALVCQNDELTPGLKDKIEKAGLHPANLVNDDAIAYMLSTEKGEHAIAEISDIIIHHTPHGDEAKIITIPCTNQ